MDTNLSQILRYVELGEDAVHLAALSPAERQVLDQINQKVGARESLEAVLDFLADALRAISPCDRFSLSFVEEHGQRVVSRYTRAFYQPVLLGKGYAEDLANSSLRAVLRGGLPRIITDLPRYLELRPDSRSSKVLVREGVRSSLTCPLRVDGRAVGLLFRSARRTDAYDDHQVLLHVAIAERLSQSVEKTYRIEQLAEANRAYFELLGFVTHELKSPVASMLTDAGLLKDGYLGPLQPQQSERLDKLTAKGKYLLELVNDYLDLSRLEGGQQLATPQAGVDLVVDVVEPAIEVVSPQIEAKRMTLVRDMPASRPPVELDPQLFRIVLVNLLGNAVKYGYESGEIRLTVTYRGDRLKVFVWNEGPGFPESQRTRLFRRFSRLQTPELMKQKGTGVGLYTSWRIVQAHGGRMEATSEEGKWAGFSFEIPQPPGSLTDSV